MATESPVRNYSIKCNTALENAALSWQRSDGANIGNAEREQILVVVADHVVDAADLKTKTATVGVVASLVLAEGHFVM